MNKKSVKKEEIISKDDAVKEKIVNYLYKNTQRFAEKYPFTEKKENTEFTPEFVELVKSIYPNYPNTSESNFSHEECGAVVNYANAMLAYLGKGEFKIPNATFADDERTDINWDEVETYTVVVPTANPNSHSYELNKPCMKIRDDHFMRMNSEREEGNHMTANSKCVRAASLEEIKRYVDATYCWIKDMSVIL